VVYLLSTKGVDQGDVAEQAFKNKQNCDKSRGSRASVRQ
jgi:hypothetical protein